MLAPWKESSEKPRKHSKKSRNITLLTMVHVVKAMVYPVVLYSCELNHKEVWVRKNWWFWIVVLEKTLESPFSIRKDWCWSWSSNTLATWCKELTHWKRHWCWERLRAGGEGGNRGWDGWMMSLTQCTWVWANSRSYWRTGKPSELQSMVVTKSQ